MNIKTYYTDGACSGNPGPGGWAAASFEERQDGIYCVDYQAEKSDKTTNNREELKAIMYVMKLAAADQGTMYEVYSDSSYAVNSINQWIRGWAMNGWQNSKHRPVENLDLMKEIYSLLDKVGFNFSLYKLSGHKGIFGNEYVDALASNNILKKTTLEKQYNIHYLDKNENL